MRRGLCAAILLASLASAGPALATGSNTKNDPKGAMPITAIVEISAGGDVKYERDGEGRIFVDRFLSAPVVYPANYGSLVDTMAGDGDPLDVLIYTRKPVMIGARMAIRPIGILHMVDAGEDDQKVIAVPASSVDAAFAQVQSIHDLGPGEADRLTAFFRFYKQDAEGNSPVVLSGIGNAKDACALIKAVQHPASGRSSHTKGLQGCE